MPHTQQHSNTATHYRSQNLKSNNHTDTQTHSAAATHTTTLHTQCACHHSSCKTQRRRGIAHPPTTASSSVQHSHYEYTALPPCCSRSRCRLLHHSSATLRLRHARSQDACRISEWHGLPAIAAATDNTALPLQYYGTAANAEQRDTQTRETHR